MTQVVKRLVGLVARLLEHSVSMLDVMGSSPRNADFCNLLTKLRPAIFMWLKPSQFLSK